jgi:7-carboxy-7-deazaguanine synthase
LLETNGSISLQNVPKEIVKIVDVKTPDSECEDSFLMENLNFIDPEKDEIKFVLCCRNDYEWSKDFIKRHHLESYKLLFSAVTENLDVKDLAEWIIEDKLPVRLQLQLHKYIWDKDEKGV